ncbi:uncharacterized protein LOC135959764 [Calliphora vicina]|uniref:uncharacterized protein LOC135959764 n=1 Tax=Calliphora vicina TaxID=7373 RepID=UPI00325ABD18
MDADDNSGNETNEIAESSDDMLLKNFLKTIDMSSIFVYLKESQVTFRSLRYLKKEDLKEAVPPLGLRVEFREKLLAWKKKEFGVDDETMSVPSKVEEWLKNNDIITTTPVSKVGRCLSQDLKTILNQTSKGKAVLDYSKRNHKLTCEQRDDLINIIIEEIFSKDVVLCTQDFKRLLDDICSVFPFEKAMKDYYYISREGKNNASGKLYSKYRSKNLKRRRLLDSLPTSSNAESTGSLQSAEKESVEIDESIAVALKTSLLRDCANWDAVCEKWKRTFHMRQKELKKFNSHEFLQEWPKLSDSRAPELINIDFDIMYPSKGHLLHSKWDKFKDKVRNFYANNIHNEYCKQLSSATNIDTQDYIYTILLNAVLPSPARFECGSGKRNKKVTIVDSQESFVLRLPTINDYKRQIDAAVEKYYCAGLTIQPFIIVEGLSDIDIKGFYIFFNNNLLKLNSFIECLDTCFKIFQTLSLKYPEACQLPWIFIQKFFYEINLVYDLKSVNITSLFNFCGSN